MSRFDFTIITAVYNVEAYVEETIKSVVSQSIGFKNHVQLILVDDGSTDNSGIICDRYRESYPDNIIVLHKENGGVSSARNAGLSIAEGKYINFLDADDTLSKNTLKHALRYLRKWGDAVAFAAIPLRFFDRRIGEHILNYKFDKGSRIIDTEKEYEYPQLHISSAFVPAKLLEDIRFDERLQYAEDAKVVLQLLLKRSKYGVICERGSLRGAIYNYRIRSSENASAIQGSQEKKNWYLPTVQGFSVFALELYKRERGSVPKHIQYTVMYDLQWRISLKKLRIDVLSDAEADSWLSEIKRVLSFIDDDIIMQQRNLSIEHKLFALRLKHNENPLPKVIEDDIVYGYEGEVLVRQSEIPLGLSFYSLENGQLTVEGYLVNVKGMPADNQELYISVNGDRKVCRLYDSHDKSMSLGEVISAYRRFKVQYALGDEKEYKLEFLLSVDNRLIEIKKLLFTKFFPLSKVTKNSYYAKDKYLLTYREGCLLLSRAYPLAGVCHEIQLLAELIAEGKRHTLMAAAVRLCRRIYLLFPHKQVWLITDRKEKARDNGEAFFKYVCQEKPKGIIPVFAVSSLSPDYERLSQYGRVITLGGWMYKWLYITGACIISSQGEDFVFNPLWYWNGYYSDINQGSVSVFLQHGITRHDLSDWLCRWNKNLDLLITSTTSERKSILTAEYGYDEQSVVLTGMPRYDYLRDDSERIVTVMPSWRAYLLFNVDEATGLRSARVGAENSTYCRMYSELLTNPRLIRALKEKGYKLQYCPHSNMEAINPFIKTDERVDVISSADIGHTEIFAQTALLITDYSSVAFDYAYLRKPLLYYKADKDEFYSGGHTYTGGYFDDEADGFGEVEYTCEALVDRIIEYIDNDCRLKDKYRERIENTFAFNDRNNCERVYREILALNKDK